MTYKKTSFDNGTRIVTESHPHTRSVSLGIWVDAGSRDEIDEEKGILHFIEHMLFKGTRNRSAIQIAKDLDKIGGFSNAFTGKEKTCFHARVLEKNLQFLTNLFSEIITDSMFDESEMELEKSVVLQEISMVEDTPDEYVQVLFDQDFWGGNPLGSPILGTRETVNKITRKVMTDSVSRFYSPSRVLVSAAGSVDHDVLVGYFRPFFDSILDSDSPPSPRHTPLPEPSIHCYPKDLEQTHICLGARASSLRGEERFAESIFNSILGGNMSSRLFQEIREERGLAYSVYSYSSAYIDTGIIKIYLAVDKREINRVLGLIGSIIKNIQGGDLSENDLARAKEYLTGGILLGSESVDNLMMRLAKNEFVFGKYISYDETIKEIERVTLNEVIDASKRVFSTDNVSLTLLGPADEDTLAENPLNF